MIDNFKQLVSGYIADNSLLDATALHLVALSGGADSTALVIVMKQLGYNIEAVHCNFHLRGKESDRDELFCENLCKSLDVPFHHVHFDTNEYAALHKVSIEMAARNLRYDYFEKLRLAIDANDILVAHHVEDNVETVLINLIRGTGIHGLHGILPKNGHIVRPLLGVSRQQIEDFLKCNNQSFVTDSTNLIDDVTRNKIRLNIIPLLKDINPAVINNINTTSKLVNEASAIVDDSLEKFINNRKDIVCYLPVSDSSCNSGINDNNNDDNSLDTGAEIDINALSKYASPEYALYYILEKYHFTGRQCYQIFKNTNNGTGKMWSSPTHELIIDRGYIIIKRIISADNNAKEMKIPEDGLYRYDDSHSFHIEHHDMKDFNIIKDCHVACLDADKVSFPLTIRTVCRGDRFVPFGMKGSKLVSDFLTDNKINILEKRTQIVFTDAKGNIVWLVNQRIDNRFCITDKTENVLVIK
nr:tRNA lysidine(34) synthetase TilS [Prevotella sp.]